MEQACFVKTLNDFEKLTAGAAIVVTTTVSAEMISEVMCSVSVILFRGTQTVDVRRIFKLTILVGWGPIKVMFMDMACIMVSTWAEVMIMVSAV